jgi:hypothetical protein
MENEFLRYEQDMAYEESVQIDLLKEISKQEALEKSLKEKREAETFEAELNAEKANKEYVRAKRLQAFGGLFQKK